MTGFLLGLIQWPLSLLVTVPLCSAGLILSLLERKGRLAHYVYRLMGRILLGVNGVRVRLSGLEHVDRKTNYLVCSNHQGLWDPFVLVAFLPLQLRWISKPAYFKIPLIGWCIRASGYLEVSRQGFEQDRPILDKAVTMLKRVSIGVFPEGHRTRDGKLLPFKKGAFYIAARSGQPILPITIQGSFERMKKGQWHVSPGLITCVIHPSIASQGRSMDELQDATDAAITSGI